MATGWPHGLTGPLALEGGQETPRQALSACLLPALSEPPCFVAFSGGRDSSAVLAIATYLARREGLADPVPVTQYYPELPETDEEHWQRLLVDHLALKDWLRLEVQGQDDLIGPTATGSLSKRGLLWPPAVHTSGNLLSALSPGWLLTGEGGDEVFGRRRCRPWAELSGTNRARRKRAAAQAVASVGPKALRRHVALRRWLSRLEQPWLRHEVATEHVRLLAEDDASEPLYWPRSLLWLLRRRSSFFLSANQAAIANDYNVKHREPLLAPRFLAALGRAYGPWGFTSRTAGMAEVFGDLLPTPLVSREGKAVFNRAFLGEATRSFAKEWDGTGVDSSLVDVDRLRQEWLSERPSALSSLLLHAAWLGNHQ